MYAVGYIRKSRVTNERHVSAEVQEGAIRTLAAQDGYQDVVFFRDMNLSGTLGADKRPQYRKMLEAVEHGEVAVIYAYSLSRLSRSLIHFQSLNDLTRAKNVGIKLYADRHVDTTTATGRGINNVLLSFAQMEAELAQERSADTIARRREMGLKIGGKFFEDTDSVVAAYKEAGTTTGAARLLNERGIKTRNGKDFWYPSSVRLIVERVAPEILPVARKKGVKNQAPFVFFQLVRCWCGQTMTGIRNDNGFAMYRCTRGRLTPGHGQSHIAETRLLPWMQAEAARLYKPAEDIRRDEASQTKRANLQARRVRWHEDFLEGGIEKPAWHAERDRIDAAIRDIDRLGAAQNVPDAIVWERPDKVVNGVLRAMWEYVQLGRDMLPVHAEWTVKEWRRPNLMAA